MKVQSISLQKQIVKERGEVIVVTNKACCHNRETILQLLSFLFELLYLFRS